MAWFRSEGEEESKKPRINICHNCTNGRVQVWRRAIIKGEETSLQEWVDCKLCDGSGRIVDFG